MVFCIMKYHSTIPLPMIWNLKSAKKIKSMYIYILFINTISLELIWHQNLIGSETTQRIYLSYTVWLFLCFTAEISLCLIRGCCSRHCWKCYQINILNYNISKIQKRMNSRGTWVAQSVKRPTLDLSSGLDRRVSSSPTLDSRLGVEPT